MKSILRRKLRNYLWYNGSTSNDCKWT